MDLDMDLDMDLATFGHVITTLGGRSSTSVGVGFLVGINNAFMWAGMRGQNAAKGGCGMGIIQASLRERQTQPRVISFAIDGKSPSPMMAFFYCSIIGYSRSSRSMVGGPGLSLSLGRLRGGGASPRRYSWYLSHVLCAKKAVVVLMESRRAASRAYGCSPCWMNHEGTRVSAPRTRPPSWGLGSGARSSSCEAGNTYWHWWWLTLERGCARSPRRK
ncbi:hypothetical protein EDB81DRAFT_177427 [Dactylonectria macrodidyma]|uniref:Uncharacterized protein n=1 Tax=Dactylonectria macrodidyma TaxID=307937 RepID=A0A9P9FQY1_9HYPO|nr:hypothetical protein EDB81DRAFT_177427 [Dactylonectria macrodidyma]